jgi:hypothetical protein
VIQVRSLTGVQSALVACRLALRLSERLGRTAPARALEPVVRNTATISR